MLDYRAVKDWAFGDLVSTYTERDTIIYALGAGFGADPTDPNELRFTYENGLRALPSMATIFGSPGPWWRDPRTGVDYARNLHAEQDLVDVRAAAVAGTMIGRNRVTALHDRGAERGALRGDRAGHRRPGERPSRRPVQAHRGAAQRRRFQRRVRHFRRQAADAPADRGGGAHAGRRAGGRVVAASRPHLPAERRLITRCTWTRRSHRQAGFPRPILHGLGTFAAACRAVVVALCDYDPEPVKRLAVRFSAPVYPGDTLRFRFWRSGDHTFRFAPSRQIPSASCWTMGSSSSGCYASDCRVGKAKRAHAARNGHCKPFSRCDRVGTPSALPTLQDRSPRLPLPPRKSRCACGGRRAGARPRSRVPSR